MLSRAAALADDPFAVEKLRRSVAAELAAAAVDQVRLRRRASGKFSRASEMWFSPSLLEQSSGEVVARYRSERFARRDAGEALGDFCCGLGSDAIWLASGDPRVTIVTVDRDPLALALTRANASVWGVEERVQTVQAELPEGAPTVPAAWIDPGRREGGRTRRLSEISPPLDEVLALRARVPDLGIKLSPASDDRELDAHLGSLPHEREWISVQGECRELVLWLGGLCPEAGEGARGHRATILPGGSSLAGIPLPYGELRPVGSWLLEPDPAVIRARLVGNLAVELGAAPIDPQLAYLTTDTPPDSPFVRSYRVEPPRPFSLKALSELLREREAGDVVLKTRGAAVQPEVMRQQLRGVLKHGRPERSPVVFITRLGGRATMMVGERLGAGNQ